MRLTLRTLLAWLDDTLSPAQVRQIGQNVKESPFARELVERINRVTRQRRLAVPPATGADGSDPNTVAAYLDNELPPEEVAEYEKRCLTSDVHLAEVASVHQILSLIGQKAKVPAEARFRMYRLVKGREAVRPSARPKPEEPEPVTQPIETWTTRPQPVRTWAERLGPVAAVLGLVALLSWSAWQSIGPAGPNPNPRPTAIAAAPAPAEPAQAGAPAVEVPPALKPVVPPKGAGPEPEAKAEEDAAPEPEKAEPPAPVAEVPAGSAGLVRESEGVLLRRNDETRDWDRLAAEASLRPGDRLVNLTPARSTVVAGPLDLDLVGPTEATLARAAPGETSRVELAEGRLVLHLRAAEARPVVAAGDRTLAIVASAPIRVGVERRPAAGAADLAVYLPEGEAELAVGGGAGQSFQGPKVLTVGPDGTLAEAAGAALPDWATDDDASPFDKEIAASFAQYLRNDRPTLTCLVEAVEDEQPEVRALAIRGLGLLGDLSLVLPELARPEAPGNRKTAIAVLRSALARGGEAAERFREDLRFTHGPEAAELIDAMIAGVTPEQARDEETLGRLAGHLTHPDLAVRQLALENLKALTGRDDLEYDPDNPEGKGLKAWQDLAAARRPAAEAPARPR